MSVLTEQQQFKAYTAATEVQSWRCSYDNFAAFVAEAPETILSLIETVEDRDETITELRKTIAEMEKWIDE